MPYVIAEPCVGVKDTACVDACPVDVIHPRPDEIGFQSANQLFIDPDNCINCGMCVPVCPVSAIFLKEDLPETWRHFAEVNANWYAKEVAQSEGHPAATVVEVVPANSLQ